ncbi:glycosyltransferase family 4 protein [Hymenobacter caeli]|uniref:Glycosyltransferase involved in cell wall biosynthesis n=1 Tax=Hymenobacter caeli TaxID=2735894 RepID=A0ABX2FL92_9BACT|nr:glycosyltransferase family 1 protein [Hymenobacter caeli]NRT17267.1 glycosyltransferase involved in cell wall biosynthesis [Hymenobacter caeli]
MKILYDHQVYVTQKFGGINRYFDEISKITIADVTVEKIDPNLFNISQPLDKTDIISRGLRFAKRKLGTSNAQKVIFPLDAARSLSSNEFDVFHPTYYNPYFLSMVNKPFVLTVYDMIHEIYNEYFSLSDPTSHNKMLLCEKATKIIAISNQTKQDIINIFRVPEEKIEVTLLASDFASVLPIKPSRLLNLKKYILFVGNRGGYKNFYFMVMALSSVLKEDEDLQILCTGHQFNSEEMSFFKSFGVDKQMLNIYLEDDSELSWVYQNAELFIYPSLYEGFGLPLLEAFASGCPVVSSTGGSLPEVGGDAALYFDPKNVLQMQIAVKSCLYDQLVRKSLVLKGTARLSEFSWDKCRNETLSIYKSICN